MSMIQPNFQFSQNNLQDYSDCPRRFQLRHIEHREWPALQIEPVLEMERKTELGRRFHEMVHQAQLGIPIADIAATIDDIELSEWWAQYLQSPLLSSLPETRRAEFLLSVPFAGYRLVAKYDLLAIAPLEKAVIVDWKTAGKPLSRSYLSRRLQTRVYPLLLAEGGIALNNGNPILPEQIEMIYWFTSAPDKPVHFHYSQKQYQEDRNYLQTLIEEISNRAKTDFPLTLDLRKCQYCVYRSLCDRGERAGNLEDLEEDLSAQPGIDIDFNQIGEIDF